VSGDWQQLQIAVCDWERVGAVPRLQPPESLEVHPNSPLYKSVWGPGVRVAMLENMRTPLTPPRKLHGLHPLTPHHPLLRAQHLPPTRPPILVLPILALGQSKVPSLVPYAQCRYLHWFGKSTTVFLLPRLPPQHLNWMASHQAHSFMRCVVVGSLTVPLVQQ
jgi:hypothetical protein